MERVFDILDQYSLSAPRADVFAVKRSGKWQLVSSQQYVENASLLSYGFLSLGLSPGDRVISLCVHNIPEWNFLDMGLMQAGLVHVPVYPYLSRDDMSFILRHAKPRLVFVEDDSILARIQPIIGEAGSSAEIYFLRRRGTGHNLQKLMDKGRELREKDPGRLDPIRAQIRGDDIATLIYTSGTTGHPKGVLLTHRNLVSNILTSTRLHPLGQRDRVLSLLPLCHIYERTSNYQFQVCQTAIYYAEHIGTIADNLREIRADGFVAVPRVLEKILEAFLDQARQTKGLRKIISRAALKLCESYRDDHRNSLWYNFRKAIFSLLVFRKLRKSLGGRIRFIGVGGAAFSPRVERYFWTAGLPTCQGYGLTETSPLISLNRMPLENHRIGTVGPPIPGVEVRIGLDGEILCRGDHVMKGYLDDPDETRQAIDEEGWFHTGDLGNLVEGRFLVISGRKKEIFKTSYGKYISPQRIENLMRESPFIDYILVVGEGQKYAAALLCPNFNHLRTWLKKNGYPVPSSTKKLVRHPAVVSLVKEEVERQNSLLGDSERIKKYTLVHESWGIKTGEITLSLKLKRENLLQRYQSEISRLF